MATEHCFSFCFTAMGPILPQISVLGKEIGVPADIMGFVTSVLPFLYILAKPTVGFLIDYFPVSFSITKSLDSCCALICVFLLYYRDFGKQFSVQLF